MFKKILLLAGSLCLPIILSSQISGMVEGYNGDTLVPLPGANVYWEGTDQGTVTDANGHYRIERAPGSSTLIASYIGYEDQSKIIISRQGTTDFILPQSGSELSEVEIIARLEATAVDLNAAELSYRISQKELRKAACCNLSESFETNATVDISFTNPVTGQKQIEMLGLAGKYALIQRENIPFARGMNATTGLGYIPGPFVESLQLTKGLSSVLNGYESLTGQINVEFHKPETAPVLMLNAFLNQGARLELNAISGFDIKPGLSTAVLAHYSNSPIAMDRNGDQFADMPTGEHFNLMNRWHWRSSESNWEGQIGLSVLQDARQGGQLAGINEDRHADSLWQYDSRDRRIEVFGKNGISFNNNDFHSFGVVYSLNLQEREARFDQRNYYGQQSNFYVNTIYQNLIGDSRHKFRTGLSFMAEDFREKLDQPTTLIYEQDRLELVPGAYFEYTYEPTPSITLVAGSRVDYNSFFEELYVTPRLNLRYALTEKTTFRIGGGRGQRTPNLAAENLNLLVSNRTLHFQQDLNAPEVGWNIGASLVQNLEIGLENASLSLDGFYSWFENKYIADLDFNRLEARVLNAPDSRSLSLMAQLDLTPMQRMELRLAYKYLQTEDNFINGLAQSYFIPQHRAFANLAYETLNRWKFDLTVNWFGPRRLPYNTTLPAQYERDEWSPDFFTVNAQVNKVFDNGLEIFAGVDNLLDFRQLDPIVSATDPGNPYFDGNYAWGPVFGRNIYAGLYYTLGTE